MPARNLFRKPFDDGTLIKLALFESYLLEWLPVFLSPRKIFWPVVNVFDFFAGPGYDENTIPGSPIRILESIKKYEQYIRQRKVQVNVYLNEFDKAKYSSLCENLKEYADLGYANIHCYNLDFQELFKELYPHMRQESTANLLFLDQNGIKHISKDIFLKLVSASKTDFLFFISSSLFNRFSGHEAFARHISIKREDIENDRYYNIHRTIFNYYRSLIPFSTTYYLAPFSIKKDANIYGLVFGTKHTLGIEKFLAGCWKLDKDRGEANFDIDDDGPQSGQIELFTGKVAQPKKVEDFESRLKDDIKHKRLKTDYHVYEAALKQGFLPRHVNTVLKQLMTEQLLRKDFKTTSADIHKIKDAQTLLLL